MNYKSCYHLIAMEQLHGVCRFTNIDGVTCYMNSILTIIQQMPLFVDYLLTIKNDSPITYQLGKLMYESHIRDNLILTPIGFRRAMCNKNSMWGKKEQQDSQEFFNFLLCSIEEELSKQVKFVPGRKLSAIELSSHVNTINNEHIYNTLYTIYKNVVKQSNLMKEYSIIKKLFGGMVHNMINCNYCGNISHNYDSFFTLQLNIRDNIYECMDDFIKSEQFDKNNMITCGFCGMKNNAHKKTIISSMPEILVIHLKRFMINNYGIVTQKISSMVKYPLELDITKYGEGDIGTYKLFGVNMHHSIGYNDNANHGHYTSIVINRNNNKWYHYNDNIEPIEVHRHEHKNAYMLFYYKN